MSVYGGKHGFGIRLMQIFWDLEQKLLQSRAFVSVYGNNPIAWFSHAFLLSH